MLVLSHPSSTGHVPTHFEVATTGKPCIRDYAELVTKEVPEAYAMLAPLPELERRLTEVVRVKPRFQEEAPLYLRIEKQRRAAFQQPTLSR